MSNTMTPGQALDWMMSHEGAELVDDRDARWRFFGTYLQRKLPGCEFESVGANAGFALTTFRRPERVLPKLPEGCEWRSVNTKTPFVYRLEPGVAYGSAADQTDRDIYAALVEEFDTRPENIK